MTKTLSAAGAVVTCAFAVSALAQTTPQLLLEVENEALMVEAFGMTVATSRTWTSMTRPAS